MNVDDPPRAAFGQRGTEIRTLAAPDGRTAGAARIIGPIVFLFGLAGLLLAVTGFCFWTLADIEKLNADSTGAQQQVIEIVNQPITHLPRSGPTGLFSPGWFDPGATKPDFNNVDIRTTQEFIYDSYGYVTSDLNPSEMFIGNELEFNSMTKYFYTDRTLPKKRLSDAEMIKINGLYRVIGQDEEALFKRWLAIVAVVVAGFCMGLALLPLIGRSRRLSAG